MNIPEVTLKEFVSIGESEVRHRLNINHWSSMHTRGFAKEWLLQLEAERLSSRDASMKRIALRANRLAILAITIAIIAVTMQIMSM